MILIQGTRRRFTRFNHFEQTRPFHSSSFVFDGDVIDVKMKSIGAYYILFMDGEPVKRADFDESINIIFATPHLMIIFKKDLGKTPEK